MAYIADKIDCTYLLKATTKPKNQIQNHFMNKIKKFFSVLLLSSSASVMSYGKAVDENAAKVIGSNFLITNHVQGVNSASDLSTTYIATAQINGKTVVDYYVFNINNGKGFVMVSGDDVILPVLAYSNEYPFDINTINPSAKDWIEGYQNQITYVLEHNLPANEGVPQQWADLKVAKKNELARTTVVTPLVTTRWDQAPYYNYLCPGTGSGKAVTGCVATAMAQIMKFWNWPSTGTGYHSYTDATYPTTVLAANYGNTNYQWTSMPNTITSNNAAIGTLMLHCGIGVDMDYSSSLSGAYVIEMTSPVRNCAEYAFKTYFHYKRSLRGVPRSGNTTPFAPAYTTANWITLLKNELNAGRPLFYSGQGTSGGHAWVCDGWDATNKMHFNWGWGGTGPDGYYSVDAIAPPALGVGGGGGNFNSSQQVIIGIQPDTYPTGTGNIKMQSHLSCTNNSAMQYKTSFTCTAKLLNSNATTFTGDVCVQVFDTANLLVGTVQTLTGLSIPANDSSATLTFTTGGLWGMIPMNYYHMQVMYRNSSSAAWTPVANNGTTFYNYNAMDVVADNNIALYDSLHVGAHSRISGQPMTVTTKLSNNGGAPFNGSVQASLININTGVSYLVQSISGASIPALMFRSYTFTNSSMTVPGGMYVLAIQHTPTSGSLTTTGCYLPYENPILISVYGGVDVNEPAPVANKVNIFPNPATDMLNVLTPGATASEIRIVDIQGREMNRIVPEAGQSFVNIPLTSYANGIYIVQVKSGEETVTKQIVVAK